MIHGSCLCRGVRFEFSRAVTPVGMCHCSKCRKVSGTASNAAVLVPSGELSFIVGKELLQTFRLPTGWGATFCRTCGCPMPHLHPGGGAYHVPAGSLDDDPGVGVGGHIYVGSKAAWDEIAGSAPQFEEEPKAP